MLKFLSSSLTVLPVMRIAINCRSFLKKNVTGIGRYALNLVQSLSEIDRDNEYWLYAPKKVVDLKRRIPRFPQNNFKIKTNYFNRGLNDILQGAELYHSPSLDFVDFTGGKVVVTVHDLIYKVYPQGHTPQTCEICERQMQDIVRRADKIICVSQTTSGDLQKFFPLAPDKISVVYQGVDKNVFSPLLPEHLSRARRAVSERGVDGPFLLFVGTLEPRKNVYALLEAFEMIKEKKAFDGRLVLIGMKGWMAEKLKEMLSRMKAREDVLFPGFVSDQELRCFYNLAEVFIYPSFYEGFGFPVLEAFCCGAPVVTSNISACAEVAADAAVTVDPSSPEDIAGAIINLVKNREQRDVLKQKALRRAENFSFRKTAAETLAVYRHVCAGDR